MHSDMEVATAERFPARYAFIMSFRLEKAPPGQSSKCCVVAYRVSPDCLLSAWSTGHGPIRTDVRPQLV